MDLLSYVLIKLAAYIVWCGIGVYLFRPDSPAKVRQAFGYGFVQALLGIGLGFGINYLVGTGSLQADIAGVTHREIYFRTYLPLRWIEWSIMGYLLQQSAMSFLTAPSVLYATGPASFFRTPSSRFPGVMWKLGGLAISFATDLPVILAMGGIENMTALGRFVG